MGLRLDLRRRLEDELGCPVRMAYREGSVVVEIETPLTDLSDIMDLVNTVVKKLRAAGYGDYVRVDLIPRKDKHLIVLKCSNALNTPKSGDAG